MNGEDLNHIRKALNPKNAIILSQRRYPVDICAQINHASA